MVKQKNILCSFADARFRESSRRFKKQALSMCFFDEILIFDEYNLDRDFFKKYKEILKYENRGFGFYIWKPQIIIQALKKIKEGDLLLYLDIGCHLNPRGKEKLKYYVDKVKSSESGILVTELEGIHLEKKWVKGDTLDFFGVYDKEEIVNTPQLQSGIIFIQKRKHTVSIIERWNSINSNTSLIDDSESVKPNYSIFIQNRQQSIFSIICKLEKVEKISNSNLYTKGDWTKLQDEPIWIKRDKIYKIPTKIQRLKRFLYEFILTFYKTEL